MGRLSGRIADHKLWEIGMGGIDEDVGFAA